ncbi:hypothetical protein [Piscirickettsia litoralis]|uniref:hypothetical protein n=1 Tax=Piscirickettsia litoralis TaxID=1891921 RepID=UPI001300CACC|nr:hypothetical protein [Piscirickettsia litoralis]
MNTSTSAHKLLPQIGLGADFIIARKYTIGLDWTHDFSNKPIERIDNYSMSFSYTF